MMPTIASAGTFENAGKFLKNTCSLRCLTCSSRYVRISGLTSSSASNTGRSSRSASTSALARIVAGFGVPFSISTSPKLSPARSMLSAISSPPSPRFTMRARPDTMTWIASLAAPSSTMTLPNGYDAGTKLRTTSVRASSGRKRRMGRSSRMPRSAAMLSTARPSARAPCARDRAATRRWRVRRSARTSGSSSTGACLRRTTSTWCDVADLEGPDDLARRGAQHGRLHVRVARLEQHVLPTRGGG